MVARRGSDGGRCGRLKQVVQPLAGGSVEVLEVPCPVAGSTEVLVRTISSVLSPGTEGAITALARSSLLTKARARPDLVRQVLRKTRVDGIAATAQAVRNRLAEDLPLGYSAVGEAIEVGSSVTGIHPGQIVATGGAGQANHAEFQAVPGLLCAVVPERVAVPDAAFATVASIALHGLRMADAGPGSKVVIVGLGLVGQLAARLALAAGCEVAGIDPAGYARDVAGQSGVVALDELGEDTTRRVLAWSRGRGADAVLICAASKSSDPVTRTPVLCRDRAPVVIVGDVGLDLDRTPFYKRELSLRFARSYGPGRYELSYEGWGVDYPAGQVRWTQGRNFEAVLDLLAAGRLRVDDLVTHRFDVAEAAAAYRLIETKSEPFLAIQLNYPRDADAGAPVLLRELNAGRSAPGPGKAASAGRHAGRTGKADAATPGIGWLGAGAFSAGTLLPAFQAAGFDRLVAVSSAGGVSARRLAEGFGFSKAVSGAPAVIDDPNVEAVVIATPHDTHAELACLALSAGRDVWCEKPLGLSMADLDYVESAWRASGRCLMIGFNRRWSPAVVAAKQALTAISGPKFITYQIAAGPVPDGHWYRDRRQGGRVLGEACHFVDTAQALLGARITEVVSLLDSGTPGDGGGGGVPGTTAVIALRFDDSSLASICYGSALPVVGKERIEVMAAAHRLVIDDFRAVRLDRKTLWKGHQDKGHQAAVAVFRARLAGTGSLPAEAMLANMRATAAAAEPGGRRA